MPFKFSVFPRTVFSVSLRALRAQVLSFFLKSDSDHSLELGLGEKHSVYDELINYQKSNASQSRALC